MEVSFLKKKTLREKINYLLDFSFRKSLKLSKIWPIDHELFYIIFLEK